MGDIVQTSDLKTALRITDSTYDTELAQLITRVERRFQGEIGQRKLVQTTYAAEKYTGDGSTVLVLRNRPIQTYSGMSVAIENESAVDHTDSNVLRYTTNLDPQSGVLELVNGRVWSKAKPFNVTVTYSAGYVSGTIAADIPDVWELLLDTAAQLWSDMEIRRKGVASQAHMSGAVTYFTEGTRDSAWFKQRWSPTVRAYKRWTPMGVLV